MQLIFAYIAGLFTLINPCVLPVLPIVLGSAINENKYAPVALAAGMSVSFVIFGMIVASVGHSIGLTESVLANIGASIMIGFGIVLVTPMFSRKFELAVAGIAGSANQRMNNVELNGLKGQFIGGTLLGAVWSPCIGPTLGGAIALASQGQNLAWSAIIMVFFALGVSTVIIGLGAGARATLRKRTQALSGLAERSKLIMGVIFIAVGLTILFKIHYLIEGYVLEILPYWLQDLSVMF